VKDIPIGKKADALFFLHTARIDQRRNNEEVRDNKKFEMARYIVNYADGQSVTIPIYSKSISSTIVRKHLKRFPGRRRRGSALTRAPMNRRWLT
jgi:beta-galactosidase